MDLTAPTKAGHEWVCSVCPFRTRSYEQASLHCQTESREFPRFMHMLHELPEGWHTRAEARRLIYDHEARGIEVAKARPAGLLRSAA